MTPNEKYQKATVLLQEVLEDMTAVTEQMRTDETCPRPDFRQVEWGTLLLQTQLDNPGGNETSIEKALRKITEYKSHQS